ncbi:MAG: hypothetical protein IPI90_14885 [Saprospiraceae bacterium]|nr:hypothetical protein [Candidatus Vicinibacter affinis]
MKKQLLKKLSGFIVTVLMLSVSANAQIVYTDVNPDTTIANRIYYLDLNNDGTTDDSIRLLFHVLILENAVEVRFQFSL